MEIVIKKIQYPLLSTWLIPSENEMHLLQEIIDGCAKKFSATSFSPHLTLYATFVPKETLVDVHSVIKSFAQTLKPLRLTVHGIEYEDNFFKSLFLTFKKEKSLIDLFETLKGTLNKYGEYDFSPHLSLLYKEISEEEKKKIVPTIRFPQTITFDRLGIITHGNEKSRMDIQNWKVNIL